MNISLIIPTYNRPDALYACLSSLIKNTRLPDEILIIDQSADEFFDKNKSTIRELLGDNFHNINIKHEKVSFQSLTAARNYGIKNSSNEIIVFSDDDIEYMDNTFCVVDSIFSNPEIAFAGAIDLLTPEQKFSPLSYFFDLKEINLFSKGYITKGCLGRFPKKIKNITSTQWGMGFCFALRKAYVLEGNIWFDENMRRYAYAEDLDFSMRYCRYLKKKGLKSIFKNDFCVKHHVSKEYRIPSAEFYLSYFGNRYYIIHKNCHKYRVLFFNLSNFGLKLVLMIRKKNEEIAVYNKAKRIFKSNKKRIANGELDYQGMIAAWKE